MCRNFGHKNGIELEITLFPIIVEYCIYVVDYKFDELTVQKIRSLPNDCRDSYDLFS